MKRIKKLAFTLLLSTLLAGNIFAAGTCIPSGISGIFSFVVEGFSMLFDSGDCPPRLCQNCRPGNVIDENGDCRPPA